MLNLLKPAHAGWLVLVVAVAPHSSRSSALMFCTICPGHAQSYPSSLHLFPSLSGICPVLFTSVPVPFQHSSQSQIHWQVDFFSLLVTLLSSCSHLDLPVVFFPFTSGPCVSVFDPCFKHLFCPWDGLALIKPSINLLSPLLKLPLMFSLLSLQFKHWAW